MLIEHFSANLLQNHLLTCTLSGLLHCFQRSLSFLLCSTASSPPTIFYFYGQVPLSAITCSPSHLPSHSSQNYTRLSALSLSLLSLSLSVSVWVESQCHSRVTAGWANWFQKPQSCVWKNCVEKFKTSYENSCNPRTDGWCCCCFKEYTEHKSSSSCLFCRTLPCRVREINLYGLHGLYDLFGVSIL